ncbi:MAG: hypothetical protein AAGD05_17770, partial [Bacteroidota bacterium]
MVSNPLNINQLLHQATRLYALRSLDQALSLAIEALHLAEEEADTPSVLATSLLLGKIRTTYGHYRGDQSAFAQALTHLDKASQLNEQIQDARLRIELLLAFGAVHQHQKAYSTAAGYLEQAQELSQTSTSADSEVKVAVYCALSQLCILQNDFETALHY